MCVCWLLYFGGGGGGRGVFLFFCEMGFVCVCVCGGGGCTLMYTKCVNCCLYYYFLFCVHFHLHCCRIVIICSIIMLCYLNIIFISRSILQ